MNPDKNYSGSLLPEDDEKTFHYKNGERKIKAIAYQYTRSLQEMLAIGINDVGKYMVFDSDSNMKDIKSIIPGPGQVIPQPVRNVLCIDMALMNLSADESFIIYNDYFFPAATKWWTTKYSRSVYYRMRRKAVFHFLKVFALWDN
jgi:hypothetical protein